ncbi:MAG: FtsQ-type POTRA domain-containing protein [Verrucomicrobiota bacterium]
MSSAPAKTNRTRTWRDIQQDVAPRSMSREGKKRHRLASLRVFLCLVLAGAAGWGGYEIWKATRGSPTGLAAASQSEPLREILLKTDGVLDLARIESVLGIPPGTPLMNLDLAALHRALVASGQVRTAVLARQFPDKLTVTIEERTPVLRVVVRGDDGAPAALLVARDGTVYAGNGYDRSLVVSLPYLDGVRLVRDAAGYQPVRGMETVADLLGTALAGVPALYRDFQVVSLARFATDGEIVVKTSQVESVTFGTREDFYRQLAKLDLILDEMRRPAGAAPIKAINLAVGGRQVPVSLADAASAPAATTRQPAAPTFFHSSQTAPATRTRDF